MDLKRFGLFSGIFISIIIVLTIILSCITTTTKFTISNPDSIKIYNHSTYATKYTKNDTPSKYNSLLEEFNKIGKLSILDRAVNKFEVNDFISQDVNQKYAKWAGDSNLKNNVCVEFVFNKTQTQIISVNGDSKRIDYTQFIFVVPEDNKSQEIAIYFMISSGANYSVCPFLINANCKGLLKLIKSL